VGELVCTGTGQADRMTDRTTVAQTDTSADRDALKLRAHAKNIYYQLR